MALLKIAGTVDDSIVDGEGYRFTIFTQGCPHNCEGCHNPHTHAANGGKSVDTEDLYRQIRENPLLSGVTFSGGEPFLQPQALVELAQRLRGCGLDITTYTGYTYEELIAKQNADIDALLAVTDVLIDGKFILAQRDLTLQFRGSRNQRRIDMAATRAAGEVIEKE